MIIAATSYADHVEKLTMIQQRLKQELGRSPSVAELVAHYLVENFTMTPKAAS